MSTFEACCEFIFRMLLIQLLSQEIDTRCLPERNDTNGTHHIPTQATPGITALRAAHQKYLGGLSEAYAQALLCSEITAIVFAEP
jgi:hypothetical protein